MSERNAIERMRATKAGAFARQARECWADSTPRQRRQMIDLIWYAWRNFNSAGVIQTEGDLPYDLGN